MMSVICLEFVVTKLKRSQIAFERGGKFLTSLSGQQCRPPHVIYLNQNRLNLFSLPSFDNSVLWTIPTTVEQIPRYARYRYVLKCPKMNT